MVTTIGLLQISETFRFHFNSNNPFILRLQVICHLHLHLMVRLLRRLHIALPLTNMPITYTQFRPARRALAL